MRKGSYLSNFLVWRVRHVSENNFILFLSVLIGIASGLAAVLLKTVVHFIQELLTQSRDIANQNYLYLAFPLIGILLTVVYIKYFNKNKLGHGITNILYTIYKKSAVMERDKMYSHMVSSSLTVGFGGSVGLEAPIVTTGSALGSNLARIFHLGYKKRILLIGCGAAGAISAIFNAPVTGVIFALEILLLELAVSSFIPILLASVAGTLVSQLMLGEDIMFQFELEHPFELFHIPFYMFLGILAGIISIYYSRFTYKIEEVFLKINGRFKKALIGGTALGILIFLLPPLYGEGYKTIKALLANQPEQMLYNSLFFEYSTLPWVLLAFAVAVILMKVFAATITFAAGGNGGIFAPSLFVGAIAGFFFARLINLAGFTTPLPEADFALVGMAGVLSGVLHAPLTGIFLIAEITQGYQLFVPLMIVSAIAYTTIYYYEPHSVYTKQLARKGELFAHDKDKEVLNLLDIKRVTEKDFKTVPATGTLGDLIKIVARSKRNIFPVVDEQNSLKGIILLDDIRHIMFNTEKYSIPVKDIMHQPPEYIYADENMDSVMKKFEDTGAWNLPVTDEGKYIGFISKSKLFSIYRRLLIQQSQD